MPGLATYGISSQATGSSGAPMWPSDLTGLILWLQSDQIQGVASGASLSVWTDSSASLSHATQPSAASQPVYGVVAGNQAGKSTVSFVGTQFQYLRSMVSITDSCTLAGVSKVFVGTGGMQLVGADNPSGQNAMALYGAVTRRIVTCGSNLFGPTDLGGGWAACIGSFVSSGGSSIATLTANNSVATASTLSGVGLSFAGLIGADSFSGPVPQTSFIGEAIVYSRNLRNDERLSLHSYLRTKWQV